MKKYFFAGAIAACLAGSAVAADSKFLAKSPEQPVHHRAILLCVGVLLVLQALKHPPILPNRRHPATKSK
ncbi:hypothetical protein GJ699_27665 [Duganella sp. FT80W]|uniref:Uncharacterized protein n=1 Tax=Duganella guangzhouensis TaxID=2666084 RepID=A0A6I2LBZ3_9BURK|nr:hypothetical protein [Duganella guangzhouensis]MRW93779.1 hypothetical protein [Duganella guangzhouensis]